MIAGEGRITASDVVRSGLRAEACAEGHTSAITGMDWSKNGMHIRTSGSNYELLMWDASLGHGLMMTERASGLRNEEWATCTSFVGWDVQGVWRRGR